MIFFLKFSLCLKKFHEIIVIFYGCALVSTMLQNMPYVPFGSNILQNMSYEYQGNSKLLYFRLNAYSGSGPNQRPPNVVAIFQSALGLELVRGILLLCPLQQQEYSSQYTRML